MGTLYLVATPIGNLEDITLRALRVLREVALIAAEDTRHTRRLLAHYDIRTPCCSYHEHNKLSRLPRVLAALEGGDVALVSDAGTPALSDPGVDLVNACIDEGWPIAPLPGPSAPTAALVASGLPTGRFLSVGFLPHRGSDRRALLTRLARLPVTLVCFEAPHRLQASLADMLTVLGDRRVVVAREMTKLHEEFVRATLARAQEHFQQHPPRGECTLVIEGFPEDERRSRWEWGAETMAASHSLEPVDVTARRRLHELHAQGVSGSRAARMIARELGLPKSAVYQMALEGGEEGEEEATGASGASSDMGDEP
jgi:16S rRNA (cytidine1402-2'-O)-methyltransferase